MKKYFAQLRPSERRLVVGVGVVLVAILNAMFIWPYFSAWGDFHRRLGAANSTLQNYQATAAQIPQLQEQLKKYEGQGQFVPAADQALTFTRTIQTESAQNGVVLNNVSPSMTYTNDPFFVQQVQNINVVALETNLVNFLYELGSDSSMIRVRDLTLQPDPPHQRLSADIRLVASYQKNPTAPATNSPTAMAK